MFYVYALESKKNGELYTGSTSDLEDRLQKHNDKKVKYTKRYAPWRLIYYEACLTKQTQGAENNIGKPAKDVEC